MTTRDWRAWAPELVIAVAVALFGLVEIQKSYALQSAWVSLLVVLGTTVAVALCRHYPAVALGVLWATCGLQVFGDGELMLVQFAVAVVAFGAARWGGTATT